MDRIPVELRDAICNDSLVVFAGAGLSYTLKNVQDKELEGWENLVKCILSELCKKGCEVDCLNPLIKRYDPIKILDLIDDENIPKEKIYSFIKDFFDLDKNNNDFELHKKIYQLSKKIITTNYDNAFEIAVPELKKNKAYKGKNYELNTHKYPNSPFLFKLHGCSEDAESMVLFPNDYKELYEGKNKDSEYCLLVLRNIIFNKSILFIGTGMGDVQINNIFSAIKSIQGDYNQKHFIITEKSIDSSLSFLTPVRIDDYSQIPSVIDDLIEIKEQCKNNNPYDITQIQTKQLEEKEERLKEIEKKLKEKNRESIKDKLLLERESLEHFTEGGKYFQSNKPIEAIEQYKRALELKSDFHNALLLWGIALGFLAKTERGNEAEDLYRQAFDKFKEAIKIKPDYHEAFNSWGLFLGSLAMTKEGNDAEDLYSQACDKFEEVNGIRPDDHEALFLWGSALCKLAETKEGNDAEDLYRQACDKFKEATDIKPGFHNALLLWGIALGFLAKTERGNEAEDLYRQAFDKFKEAIKIKPDYHEAFNSWGLFLGSLAMTKEGNDAEDLYSQACDKFEEVNGIRPDDHEALFLWGSALCKLAETKEGNDAEDLYGQACDKFKEATVIKPDFHNALQEWGTLLGRLAMTKEGNDAEDLYSQACDKFEKVIGIRPDNHEALFFWGNALGKLVETKEGNDAEDLYNQACDKFKKAIDIKPNYYEAFNSWGLFLGHWAKIKRDKEAEYLYSEAFDKFEKALEYGASPYHLSCIRALKGDREEALELLEVSLSKNEINAKIVENDGHWINYRRDEKFLALLNKYKR